MLCIITYEVIIVNGHIYNFFLVLVDIFLDLLFLILIKILLWTLLRLLTNRIGIMDHPLGGKYME